MGVESYAGKHGISKVTTSVPRPPGLSPAPWTLGREDKGMWCPHSTRLPPIQSLFPLMCSSVLPYRVQIFPQLQSSFWPKSLALPLGSKILWVQNLVGLECHQECRRELHRVSPPWEWSPHWWERVTEVPQGWGTLYCPLFPPLHFRQQGDQGRSRTYYLQSRCHLKGETAEQNTLRYSREHWLISAWDKVLLSRARTFLKDKKLSLKELGWSWGKDTDAHGVLQKGGMRLPAAWSVLWDQGYSAVCTSVLERGRKTQKRWSRFCSTTSCFYRLSVFCKKKIQKTERN